MRPPSSARGDRARGRPGAEPPRGLGGSRRGRRGTIVWAEGFGWRDVDTRTPVTPKTRFNIGTAASAITAAAVAPLGLTNTGAESAVAWSPEQIGEPGEDFPLFTIMRHVIFQPIGCAPRVSIAGRSRDILRPADPMTTIPAVDDG